MPHDSPGGSSLADSKNDQKRFKYQSKLNRMYVYKINFENIEYNKF